MTATRESTSLNIGLKMELRSSSGSLASSSHKPSWLERCKTLLEGIRRPLTKLHLITLSETTSLTKISKMRHLTDAICMVFTLKAANGTSRCTYFKIVIQRSSSNRYLWCISIPSQIESNQRLAFLLHPRTECFPGLVHSLPPVTPRTLWSCWSCLLMILRTNGSSLALPASSL